jgi:Na+-driven multidrug efflux pump
MFGWKEGLDFRRHYFSVFVSSVYLGIFSCSVTLVLVIATYWNGEDFLDNAKRFCAVAMLFSIVQAFICLMILRGSTKWVWGMLIMHLCCFIVTIPAFQYSPHPVLYCFSLGAPIVGWYCLSSANYRRMLVWLNKQKQKRSVGNFANLDRRQEGRIK